MDPVTLFLALGLGAESLVCLYSVVRFRTWYRRKGEGDPYLARLRNRNTRVGLGAAGIAVLVIYSLVRYALPELEIGPLVAPVGSILIGSSLAWMMWGPIDDWLTVRNDK